MSRWRSNDDGASLQSCSEVQDRLYPLLLRTVTEREHQEILEHTAACESCRVSLEMARGRLERLGGVALPDLGRRTRSSSASRRRLWLTLLPIVPAVIAYVLLILQGIQLARYSFDHRVMVRLEQAILRYREAQGTFPPADSTPLSGHLTRADRGGPYLDLAGIKLDAAGRVLDQWGNAYVYTFPGVRSPGLFDLQSFGSNGNDDAGRGDDIANY